MTTPPGTPASASASTSSDHVPVTLPFQNHYARLPERLHRAVVPTAVRAPRLIQLNEPLAAFLGLDAEVLRSAEGVEVLAGNRVAGGSEPLSQAYAGHQFGHFVPQLGDGRAILLGELAGADGRHYDVQLKGAGRTPFSRGGDGRAALGPVLREYLLSEAMTALGVPSTRALAAVLTGDIVQREVPLPGAVLTRIAASHLRVGTFQFFAARNDVEALQALVAFAFARHYPELAEKPHPARLLLEGVIARQARLVAQWLSLGFVHGVMNTDNTSISGETIDYGPCAFLEAYDPETVFSSIDRNGRYAYRNQPAAMLWNLMRLAEALLPVLALEAGSEQAALGVANEALSAFEPAFEAAEAEFFNRKLGLATQQPGDGALRKDLLDSMAGNEVDFTSFFRRLGDAVQDSGSDAELGQLFRDPAAWDAWSARWRHRLTEEPRELSAISEDMLRTNPAVIPRNHLVEATIQAGLRGDFEPFRALLGAVGRPYDENPEQAPFMVPARPEEQVLQTFCGT